MKKILLNKGDALFWHPSLMHGSSLTQKEGKSRKSITAHYYPVSYLRGGNGQNNINKLESSYQNKVKREKKKMRSFGYPILVNKSRRQIFFTSSKGLIRFLFLKNKSKLLMNRSNYDWNSLK